MTKSKTLFVATIAAGVLSLVAFGLERLALTDIFHGEADVDLEWTLVNAALAPVVLFHVLGLVSAAAGLRRTNSRGSQPERAG